MAKGKGSIKGWITKNGVHIPIYGEYTVRGGVEPKAKGTKWKKRFSAEGVKKALNRNYDADSNETWYEGKINGKDVRITQENAGSNKFWNVDIGKPGDRHKLLTDNNEPMSFKSLEDAHEEIAHELNSNSGQDSATSKGKKDKYTDRDWNKDVDDAKRYGYSEQSETGKKPVTKAEEEKQARQSFRDKKAQEQGFASAKDMESYNAETGVNRETWKATPESYAQSKGKSIRDIAQEVNNNDAARAQANQLMKDGRTYDEAAALAHSDMERGTLKGQRSSTPKVSKTDAYNDKVFADFKANGKDYQRVPMEGYAGTANDFRAAAKRAGVEIEYDKGDDTFYLRKSKQDSLSANTNERSRIRGELHAKDKAMKAAMPTTVSGLRSAYADATGSMKSKIAAELRRKGYSLIGGKWVKGK